MMDKKGMEGKTERERERVREGGGRRGRRGQGQDTLQRAHPLGPISESFHHLPIMASNYESFSGSIHQLGHSSRDPDAAQ
jgi:hypothetical protein